MHTATVAKRCVVLIFPVRDNHTWFILIFQWHTHTLNCLSIWCTWCLSPSLRLSVTCPLGLHSGSWWENWYFSLCVNQSCGPDLVLSASSVQSDTKAESGLSAGKWGERVGCELTFQRTFWDQVSKKTGSGFIRFLTVSTRSKSFQKCAQVPSNNSSLLNCLVLFLFVFLSSSGQCVMVLPQQLLIARNKKKAVSLCRSRELIFMQNRTESLY